MNRYLPLLTFFLLMVLLSQGLLHQRNAKQEASRVSQPWPEFPITSAEGKPQTFSSAHFEKQVTLVNMFASWCVPCRAEMPDLVKLKTQTQHVRFEGIAWNDTPNVIDPWLKKYGNPFDTVWYDATGQAAIALGIRGVPETFIVDTKGVIRYHHIGVVTPQLAEAELLPLIAQLQKEK